MLYLISSEGIKPLPFRTRGRCEMAITCSKPPVIVLQSNKNEILVPDNFLIEVGGKWAYPQKHVITTLFSVKVVEHHIPKNFLKNIKYSKIAAYFCVFLQKFQIFAKITLFLFLKVVFVYLTTLKGSHSMV